MSVSLNAYDYIHVDDFRFEALPDLPTLSPGSGPVLGGTNLRLYGSAMRNVPGLACLFGARISAARWQADSLVECTTPDLHEVVSAVAIAPDDSTPEVEQIFDQANTISHNALAAAPIVDLIFDESVASAARAARLQNVIDGLDPSTFTLGGAAAYSGDVLIADSVAQLSRTELAQRGAGLISIHLPNCNAPLYTFDLYADLLFRGDVSSLDTALGGVSIEYGPEPTGTARSHEDSIACADGTTWTAADPGTTDGDTVSEDNVAAEIGAGINVSLLASAAELVVNVEHNGSTVIEPSTASQSASAIGPPLDVWLGLHAVIFVLSELDSQRVFLNLTLGGTVLSPPIQLPNWEPQRSWSVRLRAVGSAGIGVSLYRVRLLSGGMAAVMPIQMQVSVGVLFVSPSTPFIFFTPPLVPTGGLVPASGPTTGGTLVHLRIANYTTTFGTLADEAMALQCRFDDYERIAVSASHWLDAAGSGVKLGVQCVAPPFPAGARTVSLQLSVNGQQFTEAGSFTFYEPFTWAYVTPRSGPELGDALLTVRGSFLHGGDSYSCRVGGIIVPGTHVDAGSSRSLLQCRSPSIASLGLQPTAIAVALNGQQFAPLNILNGSFEVHAAAAGAQAWPLSGPANGGTTVEVTIPGGRLQASTSAQLRYRCVFGNYNVTTDDQMLITNAKGVVVATRVNDAVLRCTSPSADAAGAGEYLEPLALPHTVHTLGAAAISNGRAALSGTDGECGTVMVPLHGSAARHAHAEWLEHTVHLRASAPAPRWGMDARVASMGGVSWSYAEVPSPSTQATVGSAGAGLGLILRIAPRTDGEVMWQLLQGGNVVVSASLPASEREALASEQWLQLWLRLDTRGLYARLGNATLLHGYQLQIMTTPTSHWSVVLGACGIAPAQPTNGVWYVANMTLRTGARLRHSDEQLRISLNGQQLADANLTFRYHAMPRLVAVSPASGPTAGGSNVTLVAENLAGATEVECDMLSGDSVHNVTSALLEAVPDDTDGAGGAGTVRCRAPAAVQAGQSVIGLVVHRDSQAYSTHSDASGGMGLPFTFYSPLGPSTVSAPAAGPTSGGTLLRISLPSSTSREGLGAGAQCRFDVAALAALAAPVFAAASLAASADAMLCISPPLPAGNVLLSLARNGLDFEPLEPLPFAAYPHPQLDLVFPAGAMPGTAVSLVGANLHGGPVSGLNYSCRFGGQNGTVAHGVPHPMPRVVANMLRAHTVVCAVPPHRDSLPHSMTLGLSLNGQQYHGEDYVTFAYAPHQG